MLAIWMFGSKPGPYAILACVIRGIAPRALRDTMAEVLENIHREYSAQLDRFSGDSAPFSAVNKELSRCLEYKYKESPKSAKGEAMSGPLPDCFCSLSAVLSAGAGGNTIAGAISSRPFASSPVWSITSFGREHGRFAIRGLRDPLAPDPQQFVKSAGLDPAKAEFHWGAYYALDDAILQQRATQLLAPPQGVTLAVKDGILRLD